MVIETEQLKAAGQSVGRPRNVYITKIAMGETYYEVVPPLVVRKGEEIVLRHNEMTVVAIRKAKLVKVDPDEDKDKESQV